MPHPVDLLVVEPQGLELPLVQPELLEGRLVHRITHARVTAVNLLQTFIEKILQKHPLTMHLYTPLNLPEWLTLLRQLPGFRSRG